MLDIVAIVLHAIGLAIILTHPHGFSPVGITLCILGNTMFYVSYVPLIAGRIAVFQLEREAAGRSSQEKDASSESDKSAQQQPVSETTALVV